MQYYMSTTTDQSLRVFMFFVEATVFELHMMSRAASPDITVADSLNRHVHSDFFVLFFFFLFHPPLPPPQLCRRIFPSIAEGGVLHCAASNDDCNDGLSIFDKKQHAPH